MTKLSARARAGTPFAFSPVSQDGKKPFLARPNTLRALAAVNTIPDPDGEIIESAMSVHDSHDRPSTIARSAKGESKLTPRQPPSSDDPGTAPRNASCRPR